MSSEGRPHSLNREKLQRLMARVQQSSSPPSPVEAVEFDWTRPHRFGSEALASLDGLGRRLALAVQKELNDQFTQTVETEIKEIREHCAYRIAQEITQGMEGPYVVSLRDEAKQCIGCLVFSFESACFLVAQMLNDPEAAVGQEGQFSALEESILIDFASILIVPLDDILQEQIKLSVRIAEQPVRGDWVMRAKVLEDLCEMVFCIRFGDRDVPFSLFLESTFLDTCAGISVSSAQNSKQGSARILERLRRAPISVCAKVSTDSICLEDLAQLEPGDVIVLGKKIRYPLEVLLNGRTCFHAFPAERKGKVALVITDSASEYE